MKCPNCNIELEKGICLKCGYMENGNTIEQFKDDTEAFQVGIYTDKMRDIMKTYQTSQLSYTKGDLNNDNRVDNADVILMRAFVDDASDYNKVYKYLLDPIANPLTPEEVEKLDQDGDNFITENDLKILNAKLNSKYSLTLRDRADIDGNELVEEFDYELLSTIVEQGYVIYRDIYGREIYKDLKNYVIPFQLGWLDVQTESILEYDVNDMGNISEVSK